MQCPDRCKKCSSSASNNYAKQKSAETGVFGRASKSDMGQRYYILQSQWLLDVSLHHPRSFLTPNRRLSSIPQCQYKSGHQHIPNRFPGTRQSQWLDFSQRPRQAVHIGRIYSIAAKMWGEAIFFRHSTAAWQCRRRTFFASFKKEEAYRREYTSEQSYRKSVEQYIGFTMNSVHIEPWNTRHHRRLRKPTGNVYKKVVFK